MTTPHHPELRSALLAEIDERAPRVDGDRVGVAFDFAAAAHGDQRRDSGEPYVTHLVEVCRVLLELLEARLDTTLACSALLHDVVEDTDVTIADVRTRIQEIVANEVLTVSVLTHRLTRGELPVC